MILFQSGSIDHFNNLVHLNKFRSYQRTVWSRKVTYMIQAKIVQDHRIPIISIKFRNDVSGDVIVHLENLK